MTYNLFHFILPFMYLLYYMFPVYDMTYNLSPSSCHSYTPSKTST